MTARRTGQYAIIEQTILIGAGIAIALGFLVAFETLGGSISGDSAEIQGELLSQYMATNAVLLVESGATGKYNLELPDSIATQGYALQMTPNGVKTVSTGISSEASLHGLPSRMETDGLMVSRDPQVALVYDGNRLELGNEQ